MGSWVTFQRLGKLHGQVAFIQIESKQAHNIFLLFRETTTVTTTI